MGGSDTDVGGDVSDTSGLDLEPSTDMDHPDLSSQEGADGHDVSLEPSFHFFTVRNFIAFFTIFGWSGIAGIHGGLSTAWTIILAILLGIAAMLIISALFYFFGKLTDSGNEDIRNAINKVGEVYLPIKAKSGNIGRIQVSVQGAIREHQAITHGEEDLPTSTVVKVVGIVSGDILVVEKMG